MIIAILIVTGLILGSFINALVWRLRQKPSQDSFSQNLSIINGRPICPNCQHLLAPKDLIPVFSWLSLRGKCRYCHKKIDDNPLVEIAPAVLFVLSYVAWPADFNTVQVVLFCSWLVFLVGLISVAVYDLKWFVLPNTVIYPLLVLAALQIIGLIFIDSFGLASAKDAVLGALVGGGLFYLLFQLSKGRWIGGGDVKLGALLGGLVGGPLASFLMIFLASLLGSIVAWPLLVSGRAKRQTKLPFGPFLVLAAIIVRLFGSGIIDWYKYHFLG